MLGWLFAIDDGGMTELANEDVWLKGGLTWLVWGFWRGDIEEWGDINSGSGLFPKGLAGALGEAWPKKKEKINWLPLFKKENFIHFLSLRNSDYIIQNNYFFVDENFYL